MADQEDDDDFTIDPGEVIKVIDLDNNGSNIGGDDSALAGELPASFMIKLVFIKKNKKYLTFSYLMFLNQRLINVI